MASATGHDSARPPSARSPLSLAVRALVAISMLVGFYALLIVVLAALVVGNIVIARSGHFNLYFLGITIAVAIVCARAINALFRTGQFEPTATHIALTRGDEPRLWEFIDALARQLDTAPPDALYLEADVNAAVLESGGSGIRKGKRVMLIGCGLMQLLDVQQLKGVLTHEYGHYIGGDTRLGGITYRGYAAIGRTLHGLDDHKVLQRIFVLYGKLYQRVTLAVRRRQELTADALAVTAGGRAAIITALQEIHAGEVAFRYFLDRYVGPIWRSKCAPTNIYAGFREMLAEPSRQEQLAEVRADFASAPSDPYDSHPTLGMRIAAAELVPESLDAVDNRPARDLLIDPDAVEASMTDRISRQVIGHVPSERVDWDAAADTVFMPSLRRQAASLLTLAAPSSGDVQAAEPTLADIIDKAASEDWRTFADTIAAPPADAAEEEVDDTRRDLICLVLVEVIGPALVDAGTAEWELSWAGPIRLVGADGRDLDIAAWVRPIIGNPAGVKALHRKLRNARASLTWTPTQARAENEELRAAQDRRVIGVLPNLIRSPPRRHHVDALVSSEAIVFVPLHISWGGYVRLSMKLWGVPMNRQPMVDRLERLVSTSMDELVARPGVEALPLDAIRRAAIRKKAHGQWRMQLEFTDGRTMSLRTSEFGYTKAAAVAEMFGELLGDRAEISGSWLSE